jgi:ATP-dependent Clp protease, protease subunit
MKRLVIGLLALGALLLTYPAGKKVVDTIRSGAVSQEQSNGSAKEIKIPLIADLLGVSGPLKTATVKNRLVLEARNTYTFRGPVTGSSVSKAMKAIAQMSRNLSKSDKIYLVLDTPGGSIIDGMDFIDFLEALPQEVKTVTLFAASMGFQIVQHNPGERLIARDGTIMSHRAAGGLDGQFNGEFESRYRMIKRKIDYLDVVDAQRVGMSFDDYQKKVKDEWWISGFDAVDSKVSDKMVLIQCGESMADATDVLNIQTMFGPAVITFDKCPLIREPISAELSNIRQDAKSYVGSILRDLFYDKVKFVKEVIVPNKFGTIFK